MVDALNEEFIDPDDPFTYDSEQGYIVLALDPGGTTGWAVFAVHPDAMTGDPDYRVLDNVLWWTAGEFTGNQDSQIDQIVELIASWPSARIVTEDFKVRQLNAVLAPVEINAAVRWAIRPRYFVKQHASLAMSTVTDDRQKAWGFWIPGKEHARDAAKHAITYLKRRKEDAVQAAARAARAERVGSGG